MYQGGLRDCQGVYSTGRAQAGTSQIITLENVTVDSVCTVCHRAWCCEDLTQLVCSQRESGE